ncbi:hypothetical protein H6P81_004087 [Aristolochia fimbriata]|uniref:Zinc-finger domain-containing protein n=1 Tax=Aristolochia fimbriata TaxID=158543 RepID=A0AAV7FGC9_ARIFI|nr:hypothetical protein H6P81_004087 [Aristolochia fimbriata]
MPYHYLDNPYSLLSSALPCSALLHFGTMAASPRASAQSDALIAVADDKMEISEIVKVDSTSVEASRTPRARDSRNGKDCHQPDALIAVAEDKMKISENVKVDSTSIEASRTPRARDSRNGKNCHQCRQPTKDTVATCNNVIGKRLCRLNICRKCLLNRYAENVDEVSHSTDWSCPKCRNICNCSVCMRKKGYEPTGILAPEAKQRQCSSVHELISIGQGQWLQKRKNCETSNSSTIYNTNEIWAEKKLRSGSGNGIVFEDNSDLDSKSTAGSIGLRETSDGNAEPKPVETSELLHSSNSSSNDATAIVTLPEEKNTVKIGGDYYPSEDMGPALQLFEFFKAFHEFFDLQEDHAHYVFREMMDGGLGDGESSSWTINFLLKLFPVLQIHMDQEEVVTSWKEILGKCISQSEYATKDFMCYMKNGHFQFEELGQFQKLRVLNVLCDEALGSEILRSWIDTKTADFTERRKEAKRNVVAAKRKEKSLKQKLKDEIVQVKLSKKGDSLSKLNHENNVSQIKSEAEKAHLEKLEAMGMVPKAKQADALRTQPIIMDENGRVIWRLKCMSSEGPCYMLQELGDVNELTHRDKWYSYNMEDQEEVEKFISFLRNERKKSESSTMVVGETDNPVNDEPMVVGETDNPVNDEPMVVGETDIPVNGEPMVVGETDIPVNDEPMVVGETDIPVSDEPMVVGDSYSCE